MKETFKLSVAALICLLLVTACGNPGKHQFEPLYTQYQEILSYSGSNHGELVKKIENLQTGIRNYLKNFPKSEKRTEAERILAETKDMQQKLQREQFDFSELEKQFKPKHTLYEADMEINEIKSFIRKYPQSVKLNRLTDRIDELNFRKFQLETAIGIHTISDINRVVKISMNYLAQIQKKNLKDQVKDKINKTEGQRLMVYQNEFHLKANELLKQMRWRAIEIAKKSHPFSNIESIKENVISGDVSTAANPVTVIREYNIHMRGAIIGKNRFRVTIQAKGIISGTPQEGVSSRVTGAVKVSDHRIS